MQWRVSILVDCFYWDTCSVKNTVELNITVFGSNA